MSTFVVCGLYPKQILMYLHGEKDCEIRKTLPNPEARLNKDLQEVPMLIKTSGSDLAYLMGIVGETVTGDPSTLWDNYKDEFKFGISKEVYDSYFESSEKSKANLIHFNEVRMIYPPLEGINPTQTYRYHKTQREIEDYPLTNQEIREKLIKKTREIQSNLREQYANSPDFLKKIG